MNEISFFRSNRHMQLANQEKVCMRPRGDALNEVKERGEPSERIEYASLISTKRVLAPSSLFTSGWNLTACSRTLLSAAKKRHRPNGGCRNNVHVMFSSSDELPSAYVRRAQGAPGACMRA